MQNTNLISSMVVDHELTATKLLGGGMRIDCKIHDDNAALVHFIYAGKDYNFALTRWKATAFGKFRSLFHRVYTDTDMFGSSEIDVVTGNVLSSTNTSDQNKNVVKQAIKDIFDLLQVILTEYPKEILDCAVWFSDKYSSHIETNYSTYIHLVTCDCIIHNHFVAGNVARKVVYCSFG